MNKYKTVTKILALSIGEEMKREEARDQSLKLEISKSLQENRLESAKLKAGEIVRIRNRIDVYDVLKIYIEQLGYDLPILQRMPECPENLVQEIQSIIYSSNVYSLKHLLELVDMLKSTYGKKFYEQAIGGDSLAAEEFKEKVMFHSPSEEQINEIIAEVNEYDLQKNEQVRLYDNYTKQKKEAEEANNGVGGNGGPGQGAMPSVPDDGDDLEALRRRLANM